MIRVIFVLILAWNGIAHAGLGVSVSPYPGPGSVGVSVPAGCDDGLLSNGCFDGGTTDWSMTYGGTNTMTVTDGVLTYTENEGSYEGAKQAVSIVNSANYTLTYDITAISGSFYVYIGGEGCATVSATGSGLTTTCNAGVDDEIKFIAAGSAVKSISIDNVKLTAN